MSPDQPGLTDAASEQPLRFGERTSSVAVEADDAVGSTAVKGLPPIAPPASDPMLIAAPARPRGKSGRTSRVARSEPTVVPSKVQRPGRRERKAQYRVRARKVRRIVRHIEAWSVLKLSLIFYLCLYIVSMVAGILLWNVAARTGGIDNVEGFIESLGAFETFEFEPDVILQGTALVGAVLVVVATGLTVLAAVLFNLISDLVGGIRVTVIEEDGARAIAGPKRPRKGEPERDSDPATESAVQSLSG